MLLATCPARESGATIRPYRDPKCGFSYPNGRLGGVVSMAVRHSRWPTATKSWAALFCCLVSCVHVVPAWSDDSGETAPVVDPLAASTPSLELTQEDPEGTSQPAGPGITPLLAPIPFKNSQIGWGLVLMAGVIHRFDADTTLKPSTGAVAGFASENGSWGVMAMEMARLAHDTWRARVLVSHVDVRYDFYGIGNEAGEAGLSVPLDQSINFAAGTLLRRAYRELYLGPTVLWMQTQVELRDSTASGSAPAIGDMTQSQLFAPGLQVEFDTRDDDYWPTRGSLAKLKASFFTEALGGSRTFQRYLATWSWYRTLREQRLVFATNINVGAAPGDAPFYALCSVGSGRFGLRGYTQGRYRDHYLTTAQAELRAHAAGRFGAAVFGGFGQVAPTFGDLWDAQMLLAGGLGLRFQLTKKYPMHMRLDYAWGRDGGLFYFSVAEAF